MRKRERWYENLINPFAKKRIDSLSKIFRVYLSTYQGSSYKGLPQVQRSSREIYHTANGDDTRAEQFLTCAEAIYLICLVCDYGTSYRVTCRGQEQDYEKYHDLLCRLITIDNNKKRYLPLPQYVLDRYDANLCKKEILTQSNPDLTKYTEDGLFKLYYEQLAAKYPTQKAMADAAGISKDAIRNRLRESKKHDR